MVGCYGKVDWVMVMVGGAYNGWDVDVFVEKV